MSHNWEGIQEINLPDEWTFFSYTEERKWEIRPEVKVMPFMEWDFDGKEHKILKVFTVKANHHCIMGYPVYLQKKRRYRITGRVWAWSSIEHDPDISMGGHYYTRLGIVFDKDNFELGDFYLADHATPGVESIDHWEEHELKFISPDDTMAYVVVECKTMWGVDHNDSYWDLDSFTCEPLEAPRPPAPYDIEARLRACEAAVEKFTQAFERIAEASRVVVGEENAYNRHN